MLEQLLDEDGLKFDVTLKVDTQIYIKLFVTIVGAVLVSAMAVKLVGNVAK